MKFKEYWGKQFGNPRGLGGKIATAIMNRMNKQMYDAVAREIKTHERVLDIGFGNGLMFKKLSKSCNARLFGVDKSPDMVRLVSRKYKKLIKSGRLVLKQGNVLDIPYDKTFNQIFTINTVYFWPDLEDALFQINTKLNKGGEFINACYTKEYLDEIKFTSVGYNKYTMQELLQATLDAGFRAELVVTEPGKSFFIKAVKTVDKSL